MFLFLLCNPLICSSSFPHTVQAAVQAVYLIYAVNCADWRAIAIWLKINDTRGAVALQETPEEGRRQAQGCIEHRLIHSIVRHHERALDALFPEDLLPGHGRSVPQLPTHRGGIIGRKRWCDTLPRAF